MMELYIFISSEDVVHCNKTCIIYFINYLYFYDYSFSSNILSFIRYSDASSNTITKIKIFLKLGKFCITTAI